MPAKRPYYVNKKGNIVPVEITKHAIYKFSKRWEKLKGEKPKDVLDLIPNLFRSSKRVENLTKKERGRLKKHGRDTMFFRTSGFTFVVQNQHVVTIEISDKGLRHLNREAGWYHG